MSAHHYEIRLRGRLTPSLAAEFEQLDLEASVPPVETVLAGVLDDQAALHGLLRRIESLGLELVDVRRTASVSARDRASLGT